MLSRAVFQPETENLTPDEYKGCMIALWGNRHVIPQYVIDTSGGGSFLLGATTLKDTKNNESYSVASFGNSPMLHASGEDASGTVPPQLGGQYVPEFYHEYAGNEDYLQFPSTSAALTLLKNKPGFSMIMVLKLRAIDRIHRLLSVGDASGTTEPGDLQLAVEITAANRFRVTGRRGAVDADYTSPTGLEDTADWHIVGVTVDPTLNYGSNSGAVKFYLDGRLVDSSTGIWASLAGANFADITAGTATIGANLARNAGFAGINFGGFFAYDEALTHWRMLQQMGNIAAELKVWGMHLVLNGDSGMETGTSAGLTSVFSDYRRLHNRILDMGGFRSQGQATNIATPGTTAAARDTAKATDLSNANSAAISGYKKITLFGCGSNDIAVPTAPATVWASIKSWCNHQKNNGWKVILRTPFARNDNAAHQANIDDLNALIRSEWSQCAHELSDVASLPQFDDQADADNTTYYMGDKVHPNAAGVVLEAKQDIRSVKALTDPLRWHPTHIGDLFYGWEPADNGTLSGDPVTTMGWKYGGKDMVSTGTARPERDGNGALLFDGSDDYMGVEDIGALQNVSGYTIAVRCEPVAYDGSVGTPVLHVSTNTSGDAARAFIIYGTDSSGSATLTLGARNLDADTYSSVTSGGTFDKSDCTLIAVVTCTGTPSAVIYRGVENEAPVIAASGNLTNATAGNTSNTTADIVTIGARNKTGNEHGNIKIRAVHIYHRKFKLEEVNLWHRWAMRQQA